MVERRITADHRRLCPLPWRLDSFELLRGMAMLAHEAKVTATRVYLNGSDAVEWPGTSRWAAEAAPTGLKVDCRQLAYPVTNSNQAVGDICRDGMGLFHTPRPRRPVLTSKIAVLHPALTAPPAGSGRTLRHLAARYIGKTSHFEWMREWEACCVASRRPGYGSLQLSESGPEGERCSRGT